MRMSSQQPGFHFDGHAPIQQQRPSQPYSQAPPLTNGTPVVPHQPQQTAFQQNAALPSVDLSALNGINISTEQLMQIAHLIQSGQLTLPLPAPVTNAPSSTLPVHNPMPALAAAQPTAAPPGSAGDDVNMDREEGELDDDDEPVSNANAHALNEVSPSQSVTDGSVLAQAARANNPQVAHPRASPVHRAPTLPHGQSASHDDVGMQPAKAVGIQPSSVSEPATGAPQPSMAVKAFVLELHRVGYGFEDLAQEVGDTQSLRNLYRQIGLPLSIKPSASLTAVQRTATKATPTAAAPTQKADTQRQTSGKPPTATITNANAKPDRASYLAKLQAAKNKKSEPRVGSSTANTVQSPAVLTAAPTLPFQSVVSTRASQHAPGPSLLPTLSSEGATAPQPAAAAAPSPARSTKVIDTELIRQRLAKLKAAQADRATLNAQRLASDASIPDGTNLRANRTLQQEQIQPNANAYPATSAGAQPSPGPTDAEAAYKFPGRQSTVASPSIARGAGLPGLFTTRTSVQQSSSSFRVPVDALSHAQASPQSQAAAAAAVEVPAASPINSPRPLQSLRQQSANGQHSPTGGPSLPKRPFGQSGMQNQAFIIETSSDEDDDGEDMDTDDSTGQQSPEQATHLPSARPVGLLPEFQNSSFDPSKESSTPGTPAGELKRKLEEIEVAKQKLEELKRRKVNIRPTTSAQNASGQSPGAAFTARSSISLSDAATLSAELGYKSPSAATYLSKQQEKEALQNRLQELESSLGRKYTSTSVVPSPLPEGSVPSAADKPDGQITGAADDDDDDSDLYDPEIVDSAADEEITAPVSNIETQDSGDEEGEVYEPQAFNSAADTGMDIDSDSGRIASQATNNSATPNAGAAKVTDHMGATMSDDADPELGIEITGFRPSSSAQQKLEAAEVGRVPSQGDGGVADGESVDDDSEDMYEPSAALTTQQSNNDGRELPAETGHVEDEQDDDNEAMDISSDDSDSDSDSDSSSDESSDDYEPEHNIAPESSGLPEPLDSGGVQDVDVEPVRQHTDDGLASGLQFAEEEQHVADAQTAPTVGFYKPYTSMLSRFKEYRYHPDFIDTVPGGHQSLTYSNNIDHEKPICPFEIGGRCNDKDCQFQHFKTMILSDNDLLREIGTKKIPAKGAEEEKKWREGLTAVVKELRTINRGKDVAVIAQRIAEYRRDFIGDPTKTLMLD